MGISSGMRSSVILPAAEAVFPREEFPFKWHRHHDSAALCVWSSVSLELRCCSWAEHYSLARYFDLQALFTHKEIIMGLFINTMNEKLEWTKNNSVKYSMIWDTWRNTMNCSARFIPSSDLIWIHCNICDHLHHIITFPFNSMIFNCKWKINYFSLYFASMQIPSFREKLDSRHFSVC